MTDYTHTGLELVGRHVPDPGAGPFDNAQQASAMGYDTLNPVSGTYEIGVVIEGAFVPIVSEKASLIFDRIDSAKQQAQDAAAQQTAQQTPPAATGPQAGVQPTEQQSVEPAAEQSAMQTGEQQPPQQQG